VAPASVFIVRGAAVRLTASRVYRANTA